MNARDVEQFITKHPVVTGVALVALWLLFARKSEAGGLLGSSAGGWFGKDAKAYPPSAPPAICTAYRDSDGHLVIPICGGAP